MGLQGDDGVWESKSYCFGLPNQNRSSTCVRTSPEFLFIRLGRTRFICTYSQNRIFKHPRVNLQLSTWRGLHFQVACQRFSKVMLQAKASHVYSINEEETHCSPPLILLFCFHVPLSRAGSRAGSMSLPEANMESDQMTPGQKC